MFHGTTTLPHRNRDKIAVMARYLLDRSRTAETSVAAMPLRLLEIGPGMAVRHLGSQAGISGAKRMMHKLEIGVRAAVPMPRSMYESYETAEIFQALDDAGISKTQVSVLDHDPVVLDVVRSEHCGRLEHLIHADLSSPRLTCESARLPWFDVVFAAAVLPRIPVGKKRQTAAQNVVALCKPGGLVPATPELLELCGGKSERYPGFCLTPEA